MHDDQRGRENGLHLSRNGQEDLTRQNGYCSLYQRPLRLRTARGNEAHVQEIHFQGKQIN